MNDAPETTFDGVGDVPVGDYNIAAKDHRVEVENLNGLTVRQALFVSNVLSGMTYKDAMIDAGYSYNRGTIHHLLRRPNIKAAFDAALKDRCDRLLATGDKVVMEALRTGMARLTDVCNIAEDGSVSLRKDMSEEALAGLAEVSYTETFDREGNKLTGTTKVKMHAKIPALKLAADLLGLNPTVQHSHQHSHDVKGNVDHTHGVSQEGMRALRTMVGLPEPAPVIDLKAVDEEQK